MTSYRDAVADLESRTPSRMVPDTARITDLAALLGDPQRAYPSIHITGTNGKTSVARMVTALLSSLGITAGTYTSPHLQSVRERIRVAGRPISAEQFAEVHAGIMPLAVMVDRRHEHPVTYFELLTAMAFWWFADHPVDVGVFEVGMGGRWDATNLVRGDVAVIGRVDLDHRELGSTRAEIAGEKVGIVKPGAVIVSAEQVPEVAAIVADATTAAGGELITVGRDVAVEQRQLAVGGQLITLRTPSRRYADVMLPLHGAHQAENAALALAALHAFLGDLEKVDDEVVATGFGAVEVPGRLEIVRRDPTVVLDGAHNPAGAARTAAALGEEFAFRDVILVVGCLQGKDVTGVLTPFRDLASHVVVVTAPATRVPGVAAEAVAAVAREVWAGTSVAVEEAADVGDALDKATGVAGESDGVLVTGSLALVGVARDRYLPLADEPA